MKLVVLHEADMSRRDFLKMLGKMAGASQLGPIADVGNVIASLSKATSPTMFASYSINLFQRAGGNLVGDLAQAKDIFGVLSRLGGGVRTGIEGRDMASFVNKDNLTTLFKWAGSRGYKVNDRFTKILELDAKYKRDIAEKGFWVDDRGEKRYHGVPEVIIRNASKGWWSIEDEHGNEIIDIQGSWNEPAEGGRPLEDPMQLVWEEIQRQLKWKIEDGKLDPNYVKPEDLEQLKKEGLKVDPGVEQAIKAPAPETRADRKQWGPHSRKVQFQFPDAEESVVRNKFEGLTVRQRALLEADMSRRDFLKFLGKGVSAASQLDKLNPLTRMGVQQIDQWLSRSKPLVISIFKSVDPDKEPEFPVVVRPGDENSAPVYNYESGLGRNIDNLRGLFGALKSLIGKQQAYAYDTGYSDFGLSAVFGKSEFERLIALSGLEAAGSDPKEGWWAFKLPNGYHIEVMDHDINHRYWNSSSSKKRGEEVADVHVQEVMKRPVNNFKEVVEAWWNMRPGGGRELISHSWGPNFNDEGLEKLRETGLDPEEIKQAVEAHQETQTWRADVQRRQKEQEELRKSQSKKNWGPHSRQVQLFQPGEEPVKSGPTRFEGLTVAQRALCEADEERRRAEREAKLFRSTDQRAQVLLARVRQGEVKPSNLVLAAAMGDEAAIAVASQFGLELPRIPKSEVNVQDANFDYFNKALNVADTLSVDEIADVVGGLAISTLPADEKDFLDLCRKNSDMNSTWPGSNRSHLLFYTCRMFYYGTKPNRANFIDSVATVLSHLVESRGFPWVNNSIVKWLLGGL